MRQRHCSICGSRYHDKRTHARHRRRNPLAAVGALKGATAAKAGGLAVKRTVAGIAR